MPDGEFLPPVQYLPWWGLLGFLLLAIVAAWWVFVFVSTRSSRAQEPATGSVPMGPGVEVIRKRYLGLIDETRAAYVKGELGDREAYHRLSLLMRSYVEEREGTRTVTLTLKELRHVVLRHRIILGFEAIADNVTPETIIDAIFAAVKVP